MSLKWTLVLILSNPKRTSSPPPLLPPAPPSVSSGRHQPLHLSFHASFIHSLLLSFSPRCSTQVPHLIRAHISCPLSSPATSTSLDVPPAAPCSRTTMSSANITFHHVERSLSDTTCGTGGDSGLIPGAHLHLEPL